MLAGATSPFSRMPRSAASAAVMDATISALGRIARRYPISLTCLKGSGGVFPACTTFSRQSPFTSFGIAAISSTLVGDSTNAMSAPAASAALTRAIASSKPFTVRASLRAMIRKSGSWRAAAAARIFETYSSRPINSLLSRWPQRFGDTWSSIWIPAMPRASNSRTVRVTLSSLP
jgi:hypothetical protein